MINIIFKKNFIEKKFKVFYIINYIFYYIFYYIFF